MSLYRLFILCFFTIYSNVSLAFLQEIETAQLKSTGGAGVGSVLLNEAAILNPASIAFHNKTSIYYGKELIALKNSSDDRPKKFRDSSRELFTISDTSSQVKGGLSLEKSKIDRDSRFRITSSGASAIGKSTALGMILKYSEDEFESSHKTYTQLDFGLLHSVKDGLSFGAVLQNFTHANRNDPVLLVGIHYNLFANMDIIFDAGTTYEDDPEENTLQRGALQLQVFNSLFLRTAQFYDKISEIKGNSWGFSWVGPKLSLEYGYKTYEPINDDDQVALIYEDEKVVENTLSLVLVY